MTTHDVRHGAMAVVRSTAVALATFVFWPGVLVRVGIQLVVLRLSETPAIFREFTSQVGGDIVPLSPDTKWLRLFAATIVCPMALGTMLLIPTLVRLEYLDVRPFASVSSNPAAYIGRSTPITRPAAELVDRVGVLSALRMWAGVACLYCCIPSAGVVKGARAELKARSRWSPTRYLFAPVVTGVRVLRGLDSVLTFGLAGAYFASGLVVIGLAIGSARVVGQLILG